MADKADNLLVALDIGSSKIACAVAEPIDPQHFKLIGMEEVVSAGMREGNVVGMNLLEDAIRAVINETEKKTGKRIQKVATGVSGTFLVSENTNHMRLTSNNGIEQRDVDSLILDAQKIPLPASMRYLAVEPQEFGVDNTWGIRSPVGLVGSRLEARLHVITAKTNSCMNIAKALARSGLELANRSFLYNPIASSSAILTPEEKRLGVLMIDIGASLTDVSLYSGDAIRYSKVFPFGGDTITNDISIHTKLSTIDAEQFKVKLGMVDFQQKRDQIQFEPLPEYSGLRNFPHRKLTNMALAAIMEGSLAPKFDQIYREIKNRNLTPHLSNGVVITGGSAVIPGLDRLVQRIFGQHLPEDNMIVRVGYPFISYPDMKYYAPISTPDCPSQLAYCSKPAYSTVMGYLADLNCRHWNRSVTDKRKGFLQSSVDRLKGLFLGNF